MKKAHKLVGMLLSITPTVHLYHLQTQSFAEHKATDFLIHEIRDRIDEFLEVFFGRFQRVKNVDLSLSIEDKNREEFLEYLHHLVQEMKSWTRWLRKETELLNLRDEMVADVERTLYLFGLVL